MSATPPLAGALATTDVEQDAGGRAEFGISNVPGGGILTAPLSLSRRSVITTPPAPAQDPEAVPGPTTEVGQSREAAVVSMVTRLRGKSSTVIAPPPISKERFYALQEWEGSVLERQEGAVRVRLVDRTSGGPEEEAEILLDDISEHDRELIKPGAVFYWSIGYHDSATRQRTRQSIIVFRRLPAWTDSELRAIKKKVRDQKALFGWM